MPRTGVWRFCGLAHPEHPLGRMPTEEVWFGLRRFGFDPLKAAHADDTA